jgi:hypothetical protein
MRATTLLLLDMSGAEPSKQVFTKNRSKAYFITLKLCGKYIQSYFLVYFKMIYV